MPNSGEVQKGMSLCFSPFFLNNLCGGLADSNICGVATRATLPERGFAVHYLGMLIWIEDLRIFGIRYGEDQGLPHARCICICCI